MLRRSRTGAPIVSILLPCLSVLLSCTVTRAQQNADAPHSTAAITVLDTTREQDGLIGPVRRVRTETAKLRMKSGKLVEGPRVQLEATTYDLQGKRIDNVYYPVVNHALQGREEYRYDDRGNISEMTLRDARGAVLSKEAYTYEFDALGNWTKMTTALVIFEGGKLTREPVEVTYRTLSYYFNENIAGIATPSSAAGAAKPIVSGAPHGRTDLGRGDERSSLPASGEPHEARPLPAKDAPSGTAAANGNRASGSSAPAKPESRSSSAPVNSPPVGPPFGVRLNRRVLSLPMPEYPASARKGRISGAVTVEISIDGAGKVISARVSSGPAELHEAALKAARRASFSPKIIDGQPVNTTGAITYHFASTSSQP